MRRILIAAGGTGGHLFPAQQLATNLKDEAKILFAGHKLEASPFFEKERYPFVEIFAHPLKRGFLSASWKGFWQSVKLMRSFAPDVVVGFGSYHTLPVLLAAAACRKKLILFEANYLLGKVNRLLLPAASKIAFQFPSDLYFARSKKGILVSWLPWKEKMAPIDRLEARKSYGLDPDRKTLLVFGGSQGASFLNENVPNAVARLKEKFQVIHLSGQSYEESVRIAYSKWEIPACVKPFESEMARAYSAADFALCRSGASTIAELIRFEIPALLVPYPFASDHQRKNGTYLTEKVRGARLVVQAEASVERLVSELEALQREVKERQIALRAINSQRQIRIQLAEIIRRI